jgi:hypothetical protein
MSFCKPLSPYNRGGGFFKGSTSPRSNDSVGSGPEDVPSLQAAIVRANNPAVINQEQEQVQQQKDSVPSKKQEDVCMMDEETVTN